MATMNKKGLSELGIIMPVLWIMFISVGCLIILGLVSTFAQLTADEVGTKDISCYDEFRNEIQGLVCNEIIYDYGILNFMFHNSITNAGDYHGK